MTATTPAPPALPPEPPPPSPALAPPARPAAESSQGSSPDGYAVVRQLLTMLGNVTVITALLIYFGWRRAETEAHWLGIDESVLGMSTQNYVLRSVGPVLALLLTVAIAGLIWLWSDRQLFRRATGPRGQKLLRRAVRALGLAWIALPLITVLVGYVTVWEHVAYVIFPLSIAAGILLALYGAYLQRTLLDPKDEIPDSPPHEAVLRGFAAILVGTCLFWSASRYAEVLGNDLAGEFATDVRAGRAVQVVVYSPQRLHITAPGVREEALEGRDSAYQYRYTGLLLLEHTGGKYFLISEGWTPDDGVVVVLPDQDKLRLEFVRGTDPTG